MLPQEIIIKKRNGLNLSKEDYNLYTFELHDPDDKDLPFTNKKEHLIDVYTSSINVYKKDKLVKTHNIFMEDYLLINLRPNQQLKFIYGSEYSSSKFVCVFMISESINSPVKLL